jgi:hypothetical protein
MAVSVALIVLMVGAPARAGDGRPDIHEVVFHTHPRGATITLNSTGVVLGRADEPVQINLEPFGNASGVDVTFSLDGYYPRPERIGRFSLQTQRDFPGRGARYNLEPARFWAPMWYWIREQAAWFMLGVVGLLAVLAALRLRQRRFEQTLGFIANVGGRAAQAGTDPLLGKKLGGYLLSQKVGTGGIATVYRGDKEDDPSAPPVAVKVLHRRHDPRDEDWQRFSREIKISASLNHPNIVKVLEWGEQGGWIYLVMEYLEGQPLRQMIGWRQLEANKAMTLDETWRVLYPILDAVAYAHSQNIVHRDLKPENVMLTEGGIKLVDFGVARGPAFTALTATGEVQGTLNYLPPERLEAVAEDARSDEYAIGVMAYEMLAGRPPFSRDDGQVRFRELYRNPPDLEKLRPDLPPSLCKVVMRMLDKDMAQRFPSVREALTAFQEAMKAAR